MFVALISPPKHRQNLPDHMASRFRRSEVRQGHGVACPTWRVVCRRVAGTPFLGHDVSCPERHSFGRAMVLVTTMMPAWQCGHSRNDRPVRVS